MAKITKWDVFFKLVELRNKTLKSVKVIDLSKELKASNKSVQNQLKQLINIKLIIKTEGFLPKINYNKNSLYSNLINIYQFSNKNKVNYNLILNKNLFKIVGTEKEVIKLSDIKNLHYETFKKYLALMLKLSFVMIIKQKPLEIRILNHPILKSIYTINSKKYIEKKRYFKSKDEEYYLKSILNMSKKIKLNTAKFNKINRNQRILFITHTTQLEGNPMQFTEVKDLIENNITGTNDKKSIRENKNIDDALNIMTQFSNKPMTIEKINKIHYQVQKYISKKDIPWKSIAGKIRQVPVIISNNPSFKISKPTELENELKRFINTFNSKLDHLKKQKNNTHTLKQKIEFATWVHSEFQHIHPYIDGNSRTTRILFNYILTEFKLPLTDIYYVKEYIDVTKGETNRDDSKLYLFFLHLIYDNMLRLVSET